jgi:cardiolipin synthase
VEVTLVVPERNNWQTLGRCLAGEAVRGEMDIRFFPDRMTHMKAMLVDDEVLLVGSANFDLISYRFQQEYLAEVTDPGLLAAFRARVVEPDLAQARRPVAAPSRPSLRWAQWKLGAIEALSVLAKGVVASAPAASPDAPPRAPSSAPASSVPASSGCPFPAS